uniref:Transposase n=1 Tax=Knipowitschia caucasica TaxID=637954 RepID=A0AAV2MI82_KNICA
MPAEKIKELVDSHLHRFKLNMEQNIVCCTTDGASVMVKFGRLVLPKLQLCYAHAVHLAVTDVLYRRVHREELADVPERVMETESEEEEDSGPESDEDSAECVDGGYRSVRVREEMFMSVERVRKIARHYHKSPVSNDKLRECTKRDHGKELVLILDCRTRWNSLADMLDCYIALHKTVSKTLIDINPALIITNEQLALIKQLSSCLKPLRKQETRLSQEMRDAIESRFTQRRQKNLVSLYR